MAELKSSLIIQVLQTYKTKKQSVYVTDTMSTLHKHEAKKIQPINEIYYKVFSIVQG